MTCVAGALIRDIFEGGQENLHRQKGSVRLPYTTESNLGSDASPLTRPDGSKSDSPDFGVDQHMKEFQAIAQSKATTMGHIQRHHLDDAPVILPDKTVLRKADEIINPIFEKSVAAQLENQALASLRDSLLPKLMSGEIHVGEAREQVEEVA